MSYFLENPRKDTHHGRGCVSGLLGNTGNMMVALFRVQACSRSTHATVSHLHARMGHVLRCLLPASCLVAVNLEVLNIVPVAAVLVRVQYYLLLVVCIANLLCLPGASLLLSGVGDGETGNIYCAVLVGACAGSIWSRIDCQAGRKLFKWIQASSLP